MIKINKEHAEICGSFPEICAEFCVLIGALKEEKFTKDFLHACIDDVFESNKETEKKLKDTTERMLEDKYKNRTNKEDDEIKEKIRKIVKKMIESFEEDMEELDGDKD